MRLSTTYARNGLADELGAQFDGGEIRVYSGTRPAGPDTALSGNTLLVTMTFADPAFFPASGGIAAAHTITGGTGVADGTATFARLVDSSSNAVADVSVGVGTGELQLSTLTVSIGLLVEPTASFAITQPAGT